MTVGWGATVTGAPDSVPAFDYVRRWRYHADSEIGAPSVTVGVGGSARMRPVDCS
jgi:hypothetical protein